MLPNEISLTPKIDNKVETIVSNFCSSYNCDPEPMQRILSDVKVCVYLLHKRPSQETVQEGTLKNLNFFLLVAPVIDYTSFERYP